MKRVHLTFSRRRSQTNRLTPSHEPRSSRRKEAQTFWKRRLEPPYVGCYGSILALTLVLFLGCATSKQPQLSERQAWRIGLDYARSKGWDVSSTRKGATFNPATGEWQMFLDIRQLGGSYIAYVKDKTRNVRFEKVE